MEKDTSKKSSMDYFQEGYNCSESTLLGISNAIGKKCNCIPQIASGFGGGLARHGEICGAISGSLMAFGIACGRKNLKDTISNEKVYEMVAKFLKKFREKFGTISCLELTGCDRLTAEGMKKFKDENILAGICTPIVEFSENEALKLLNE